MKKTFYILGTMTAIMAIMIGSHTIFANITNTQAEDKPEQFVSVENSPLSIVGLVTEIKDNSVMVYARDNNYYEVDLSNAKIVSGDLGYYAKDSSFDDIKITDHVTVIFDYEPYNFKINAKEIAHKRTPETIIKRNKQLADLFNVELATSTDIARPGELENITDEESTTTVEIASSSTEIMTAGTSTNENVSSTSENYSEGESLIDNVADVAKDVIQGTADVLINIVDIVTGQENTQPENQPAVEQNIQPQEEVTETETASIPEQAPEPIIEQLQESVIAE